MGTKLERIAEISASTRKLACKLVGKTNNVVAGIEKYNKFSESEINDAMNCARKKFKDFKGCNLTDK